MAFVFIDDGPEAADSETSYIYFDEDDENERREAVELLRKFIALKRGRSGAGRPLADVAMAE